MKKIIAKFWKALISDPLETLLRKIEESDRATSITPPKNPKIRVIGKKHESLVYDSTANRDQTPFDSLMNHIVILAILVLVLEWLLGGFGLIFATINAVILVFFIFEFLVRWNFRRWQYLRTWGLRVDLLVIIVEATVLILFYLNYSGGNNPYGACKGIILNNAVLIDWTNFEIVDWSSNEATDWSPWIEKFGLWKILRLARLLRLLKLFKDISQRPDVWKLRIGAIVAWLRGIFEAILILMGISVVLAILTRLLSTEDPETLIRSFIDNLLIRLRADQNTGIKNSEVLAAIYQVFSILAAMLIVTFFAQLLLPIVSRIKNTQQQQKENSGRKHHVIIAVIDGNASGLIEEAIQIWAVYEKNEVVLIVPENLELDETIHPSYAPHVIRGSIYSRGSWLAADTDGADQIIVLSDNEVKPKIMAMFLPVLSAQMKDRSILLLSLKSKNPYEIKYDQQKNRYACIGVDPLKEAIEKAIGNRASVQYQLTAMLNEKFDKATNILGNPMQTGDPQLTKSTITELLGTKADVSCHSECVLVDIKGDPGEQAEGKIISRLRDYIDSNHNSAPILVFVDSLHLVGINSQLGNDSQLRVVPIELLLMYAVYHEAVCTGIAQAWTLPPDALKNSDTITAVETTVKRTTYRNRQHLIDVMANTSSGTSETLKYSRIIGILTKESQGFNGYLTNKIDTRKLERGDKILVTNI